MKNSTKMTRLLTLLGIASMLSTAGAQTTNMIFGTDFESSGVNDNLAGSFGYAYAGGNLGGAASAFTGGLTAGVGSAGSAAFLAQPDFTPTGADGNYTNSGAFTYSGTVIHLDFGAPLNALTPTANVDSYTVSFDAKVQGLTPGANTALLEFKTDGAGLTIRTNGVAWLTLIGADSLVSSNFTHFEIPLSTMTLGSGSFSDLTNSDILATVDSFTVEFRVLQETGALQVDRRPIWGFDNDNQLIIDNFQLAQAGNPPPPPPKYERLLWQVNFDDQQPGNALGFSFRDGANTATVTAITNATSGVGGSAALEVTADLSSWATNPPSGFSGFGPGVGHPIPYTLTNSNKSGYRVYWTAKAGGFLDGITQAAGNASIRFIVPPGTLTPSNAAPAIVLELAPNITLSSNYTDFVFEGANCPVGLFNGGSQALFNQYISQINQIEVRSQFNGTPDVGATVFGYDADNTVTVDNIKVVEIVQGIAPLSIVRTNGSTKVFWSDPINGSGTAKLQSSTNAAGPYFDVSGAASGATSPYTIPPGSSRLFLRSLWVP